MKKRVKNILFYSIAFILAILLLLFFIRLFSDKQIDDVTPEIPCQESLLKKSDVLYVIPKFNNKSIADNQEWCNYILNLNKELALHGVYHTYKEFESDRDEQYLQKGINIFKACFQQSPERFKPPQLIISTNNKKLIKEKRDMNLDGFFNQILHKVYHCNDSGRFPNWVIDII